MGSAIDALIADEEKKRKDQQSSPSQTGGEPYVANNSNGTNIDALLSTTKQPGFKAPTDAYSQPQQPTQQPVAKPQQNPFTNISSNISKLVNNGVSSVENFLNAKPNQSQALPNQQQMTQAVQSLNVNQADQNVKKKVSDNYLSFPSLFDNPDKINSPSADVISADKVDMMKSLNPIDALIVGTRNFLTYHPAALQTLADVQQTGEDIFNLPVVKDSVTPLLSGVEKGVAQQYLGSSKEVQSMLDMKLKEQTTFGDKALYTVGDIVGTIGAFIAGGEVIKAAQLGKATLPVLFGTLGQLSSNPDTTIQQRIEKLPVDVLSGFFMSMIPPTLFDASKGLMSSESVNFLKNTLSGAAKLGGVMGAQTLLDEIIEKKDPKQIASDAGTAVLTGGLFHIVGSATGFLDNAITQSRSKTGTATFTSSDVRDIINRGNMANTKIGQGLSNLADMADKQGKDVQINMEALQKTPIAAKMNMDKPEGINLQAKLVDREQAPSAQLQPEQPNTNPATPRQAVQPVAPQTPQQPGTTTVQQLSDKLATDGKLPPEEARKLFEDPGVQDAYKKTVGDMPGMKDLTDKALANGDIRGILAVIQKNMSPETRAMVGDLNRADTVAAGGKSTNPQVGNQEIQKSGNPENVAIAKTPEQITIEAKAQGIPEKVIKAEQTTLPSYARPTIGKADLETIMKNSDEFKKNPVLTVDGNKDLVYDNENMHFKVSSDALQLAGKNVQPGEKIRLNANTLQETGKPAPSIPIENKQPTGPGAQSSVLGFNPKNLTQPFSKAADGEVTKIVKQSEIAKTLSDKLNVPIRQGKFRVAGAIGIYKSGPKVVRIKSGGLSTVFHEVGHFLDDTVGFSRDLSVVERRNLMQEYGNEYKGNPTRQEKEAFAEYLRYYMTGQTEKIAQWAPEFDKTFQEKIQSMPQVKEVIDAAKADYTRWAEQPSTSKILSQISIGKQEKPGLVDRTIQSLHDIYTAALDDLHPLSEFSKLANKNIGKIPAEQDPYILARNLRGWAGKADLFLNRGTFGKQFWVVDDKGNTKINYTGKGYSEIMRPVEKKGNLDDFRVYIVAQRVVNDLSPRGIKSGITLDDAKQALVELDAKHPEFAKVAADRRAYKDSLLDFAKDNGLIGENQLAKIKELNKFHAPFYRVMEEVQTKFLGKSKVAGNIANPIKSIKGSEREIIDPLESDVKDTYAIINAAERNNIGIAMANIAKSNSDLGRLFEEVAAPMKAIKVNVQEVMEKALKDSGAEGIPIPEELGNLAVNLFRPTYATGPNMLNVNMGDKQKVFEVDPDIYKAIQGLNLEDMGMIIKILSAPATVLRAGATLSPDFSVRNPLRDQFTAFVYSKNGFIPGVDLVRGMFELFKKDDVYDLWKAGGGEHATFVSLDREVLQKNFTELFESPASKALNIIKNPIGMLQLLSELGEAGTRLGEMRNALSRGQNPIEAAYSARNVTLDFARIGAKTKSINAIDAFFNANLQGTDTLVRNFKSNPFPTLLKVMLGITLPSVLLYFANRNDPRWKEIPTWQKDLFWIVMTPNHIWRIPKPFELGVTFGSIPERVLEVLDTKNPKVFNQLESDIISSNTPGFVPTAILPIIENISNYSFFLNRPIVTPGKEGLPGSEQSGTYTTETSKFIGKALNYSPAKVDNLINGYSGGTGKYAVSLLDKILEGTGIAKTPSAPAPGLENQPVIKAFMVQNPVGTTSESVNDLYQKYQSTYAQYTFLRSLLKDGKREEAQQYLKDHPDTVQAISLSKAVNDFGKMNHAVDEIRKSGTLTPDQKARKIQMIQTLQTKVAERVLKSTGP